MECSSDRLCASIKNAEIGEQDRRGGESCEQEEGGARPNGEHANPHARRDRCTRRRLRRLWQADCFAARRQRGLVERKRQVWGAGADLSILPNNEARGSRSFLIRLYQQNHVRGLGEVSGDKEGVLHGQREVLAGMASEEADDFERAGG